MGLATEHSVLLKQSDMPEIFQLAGLLACFCAKGLANRAHAYKAAAANNLSEEIVNEGYTLALTECRRIMEENFNFIPPGSTGGRIPPEDDEPPEEEKKVSPWNFN